MGPIAVHFPRADALTGLQRFLLMCAVALVALGFGLRRYEARQPRVVTVDSEPMAMERSVPGGPVHEYQVTKPALPKEGNPAPRYPRMLEMARVEGSVLVQFVIDTNGVAEMNTLKILKASDERFADAVIDVLPSYRFTPAESDGHKVRQYVSLPFLFKERPH
jgi:TonB family protein